LNSFPYSAKTLLHRAVQPSRSLSEGLRESIIVLGQRERPKNYSKREFMNMPKSFFVATNLEVHPDCCPMELIGVDSTNAWEKVAGHYGISADNFPDSGEDEWETSDEENEQEFVENPGNIQRINPQELLNQFHSKLGIGPHNSFKTNMNPENPEDLLRMWKFLNDGRDSAYLLQ
jgi:hypothetical protein